MASQGYSKPLYLTEGGYYDSLMSPKDQTALNLVAYDVVKLHATAFGEGVKLFIWLPGVQKNSEGIPKPYQGLYAENRRLLPSGDAYQILISKIGGFSDFGQIALKKEVSAYEVVVNQKKLIIAWADSPTTMSIDTLPFKATQVTDYLGQTVNISNGVLNLTDRPFYIE